MQIKKVSLLLIVICYFGFSPLTYCNCPNIDSLLTVLDNSTDTAKFSLYSSLVLALRDENADSAMYFAKKGLELAKNKRRIDQAGKFIAMKGYLLQQKGELDEAIKCFDEAYNCYIKANLTNGVVRTLSDKGATLMDMGNYNEAGEQLFKALKLADEHNYTKLKGAVLNNIGLLFFNQEEWDKSIGYYRQSIPYKLLNNDQKGLALCYNNIGIAYYYKDQIDSVLANFYRSLDIYVRLGDKLGQTRPLFNIGEIYYTKGNYAKAMEYYNKSLNIERELGYKKGMAGSLVYIGNLYAENKEFKKALSYEYEGLKIFKDIHAKSNIKDAYEALFETYQKLNNPDSALHYHILYTQLKDSIFTIEKSKQISELETKYKTKKKEHQIALQQTEMKRKSNQNIALSIILFLTIGVIILLYRYSKIKQRANEILEEKNRILYQQNRQITNSITYAGFIQAAILPPLDLFHEFFPDHFIVFKPKDIVSGDFYWLTKKDDRVFVAVADCTGHGVPGAFMSMLGMTLLNEIINIYGEVKTDRILNLLREKIIAALRQRDNSNDSRDGMDIALYSFDKKQRLLEYSGAYTPLIIFSDNNIIELEADKMPIGYHKTRNSDFGSKAYQLKKGDIIYLFSDGYADQFGGDLGKKFTRKRFYDLLSSVGNLSIKEQMKQLNENFLHWKGDNEQIDDVTIVGIKV